MTKAKPMRSQVSVAFDHPVRNVAAGREPRPLLAGKEEGVRWPEFLVLIVFLDLVTAISFGGMSRR